MRTRLTELLGIEHPVMLAGMAASRTPHSSRRCPRPGGSAASGLDDVRGADGGRDGSRARGDRATLRRRPADGHARRSRRPGRDGHRRWSLGLRGRPRGARSRRRAVPSPRGAGGQHVRQGRPRPASARRRVRPRRRPGHRGGRPHRQVATMPLVRSWSTPSAPRSPSSPPAESSTAAVSRRTRPRRRRRLGRHALHRDARGEGTSRLQGPPPRDREDGTTISRAFSGKTMPCCATPTPSTTPSTPKSSRRSLSSCGNRSATGLPPRWRRGHARRRPEREGYPAGQGVGHRRAGPAGSSSLEWSPRPRLLSGAPPAPQLGGRSSSLRRRLRCGFGLATRAVDISSLICNDIS